MRAMRADDDLPSTSTASSRKVIVLHHARAHGIVDIVIDVGNQIGDAHDLPFERRGALGGLDADGRPFLALRVPADTVANLPREVESTPVVLEHVHDAQALLVVPEPSGHERVEHALAGVAERRMTQIVAERDRLGQLFVQSKHLRDRARDLRDLECVREARAVVVALRREEDLRLVLQPAERLLNG